MEQFIGCDAHKKFSVFVAVNEKGQAGEALRVAHDPVLIREFLSRLPAHSAIAVEASRNYSWLVDEMERAGHRPKLCNPLEAKRRMGLTHKTDKLDARGLAILLRNRTLPEVWIDPSRLPDPLRWREYYACEYSLPIGQRKTLLASGNQMRFPLVSLWRTGSFTVRKRICTCTF